MTIAAATASAVVTRAVVATAEEDIHQTAEAATETAVVAMASAEATVTILMAEREELHPTDRAVHLTGTGRLMDSVEAMEATAMTEERGGHPTADHHSVRVVHHTVREEVMVITPKVVRKENHLTGRAVLHSERDAHHTDREEATVQVRKVEREGLHIQGSRPQDTDSALSREVSLRAEALDIRGLRSSDARTNRISQRLTKLESTRCFQGSRRLT